MTPVEHLTAVRALISTPDKWARGEFARDMNGNRTSLAARNAACFCILGAIGRTDPEIVSLKKQEYQVFSPIWDKPAAQELRKVIGDRLVSDFNDDPQTTHDDMLRVIDAAIERLNIERLETKRLNIERLENDTP